MNESGAEKMAYLVNCPCWSLEEFRGKCATCEPPDSCRVKPILAALCADANIEHTSEEEGEKIKHRWVIEAWREMGSEQ
jgi:hypothetical protein